ncbi:MAG: L,D-transpeptidase [Verrucomicrobiota bacterium]
MIKKIAMKGRIFFTSALVAAASLLGAVDAFANVPKPTSEVVIDVDGQKLDLLKSGQQVASFRISTSKFGLGDDLHSYKTPLGTFEVCSKLGDELPMGAVIKRGHFTGEVLPPNAPGRDPIVTRVIRLQGLEPQNRHALGRGIYIHGTPEERRIGKPVSWGCIRMRSKDVVELFKQVQVGTRVIIRSKAQHGSQPGDWLSFTNWFS